jgi:UDP-N-acetylglucosamine:LPS N-acetylglucosamine transferase
MKVAVVVNRGGHLTEALQVLGAFKGHELLFIVPHNVRDRELLALAPVIFSRRVDANFFRFMVVFFWAIGVLRRERPDVIFSTGTENVIPFFFWGKLFGIKTMYLESWCRVEDLSVTGKIVYPWVDEFWVQWPQLLGAYPRARFHGTVI